MIAPEELLARVGTDAAAYTKAAERTAKLRRALHGSMRAAVEAGVPSVEVARVAGVSKARVSQIAPVPDTVSAPIHAQKSMGAASCVSLADAVAGNLDTLPPLSGVASTRKSTPYGKATGFLDSTDLREVLAAALHHGWARVYLTGAPPEDTSGGATRAESVRAWAMQDTEGWTPGDHYLAYADLPLLRFTHTETGHKVVVMRAASWWGESDADAQTCLAAWNGLEKMLGAAFPGFTGLADTPATTGKALWLRTIPAGKSYPVLSQELRELIQTTTGQGRIELLPAPAPQAHDFTIMDGRLMYASLTWGMPVGPPRMWTGRAFYDLAPADQQKMLRGRGRWRITAKVPEGWAHVGLLAARRTDSETWAYPRTPGQVFTTWADGAEVWLAIEQGWGVEVHEGMTWAEGKPLDKWRDALVSVWESANTSGAPAARLAAKAVRSILLFGIGGFVVNAHPVTRTASPDSNPDVPPGTEVRLVGDRLVWQEPGTLSSWSESTAHPEWAATIWARARVRLLAGIGGSGALSLDPSRVVAFATDALYLAGGAPEWADDGKPGRFRMKGHTPGPFAWPSTYPELYRLRDAAGE